MGLLRLFLALSVIAGHSSSTVFNYSGAGAWYSVNFFYVISGYYMSMIINEKYACLSPIYFYTSRALRLFPAYLASLLLSLIVSSDKIYLFFNSLGLNAKIFFLFQNIFIFGLDTSYIYCFKAVGGECANPIGMTINPPSWSLAIELYFYLIAPAVLSSTKKTIIIFFISLFFLVISNFIHFPLSDNLNQFYLFNTQAFSLKTREAFNYYFFPDTLLFFTSGALSYQLGQKHLEINYLISVFIILILACTTTIMPFGHLILIVLSLPIIFNVSSSFKIDRFIGEFSYPVYIFHFPILLFFQNNIVNIGPFLQYATIGTLTSIASLIFGLLFNVIIEKRFDSYRHSLTLNKSLDSTFKDKYHLIYKFVPVISLIMYIIISILTFHELVSS